MVPLHVATSMDAPNPDAGEEHPHTNTQLFATVAPEGNRFLPYEDMQPPPLGQYLLGVAIALDTMNTGHVPAIDPKIATGQQAHDYLLDRQARIWPGLIRR